MRKTFLSFLISFLFFFQPITLMAITQPITAITTHNLNIRKGAGTNYKIQNTLPAKTFIQVMYCSNTWCMIQDGKDNGWVSKKFIAFPQKENITKNTNIIPPLDNNIQNSELGDYWQDNWYWSQKD